LKKSKSGNLSERKIRGPLVAQYRCIVERNPARPSSPLCVVTAARVIYENMAHHLSGHGEEMDPVLPMCLAGTNQLKVSFVNQSGPLKRLARFLLRHLFRRQPPQLIIDHWQKLVGGVRVTLPGGGQDASDLVQYEILRDKKGGENR
jgi:hypothetical protein